MSPLKSLGIARRMKDVIPGVSFPQELFDRLEGASDFREESKAVAVELIEGLREIPGVHGIHVMPIFWESVIPELFESAGLLPRPH